MVLGSRKALTALAIVAALIAALATPVIADSKSDLERQRRGVSGKIDEAQKSYDESSKKYLRAVDALNNAQAQLNRARVHLGETRGQVAVAAAKDAQMQADLERSEAALAKARRELKAGNRQLKESTREVRQFTVDSLEVGNAGLQAFGDLLRGESPTAFSDRMNMTQSISDAQVAKMQELAASKVMLRINRDKVEELRDQVAVKRREAAANLLAKKVYEKQAEIQETQVSGLVKKRSAASSEAERIKTEDLEKLRALENERASLENRLAALAVKEKKTGGKNSGGDGGSTLSRPVSGPITSSYGMRWHPITGIYKLHDGTDFGVACGTPIRAAAGGTIIEQYYNAGYGNRVIVNHGIMRGRNVVTTYNHLSRFRYSSGKKVKRGDVIGYVGTTGYSTGCHLHFMVIANGATTNPMGWL